MNQNFIFLLFVCCLYVQSVKAVSCDDGTYDNGSGTCLTCPQYCTKCTDANTCTECQASTFIYKSICISQCPSQSKVPSSGTECDLNCKNEGEYPNFDCKTVTDDTSAYCLQQIPNLQQDNSGFSFQIMNPTDKENLNLKVLFFNVPSICYTFDLHLGTEAIPPLTPAKNINSALEILYQFPIKKMDPLVNGACQNELCSFTHKLLWKGMLQYTYSFDVQIVNNAVILSEGINIISNGGSGNPICVGCQIPKELQLKSNLKITCDKTANCGQTDAISTTTGEQISITQVLEEERYKQNTLKPFSINLKIKDESGVEVGVFEIKNFESDNTTKGQITYKFNTVGFKSGTLVIISKIDKVIFSRRQLASNLRALEQIQGTKYPYQEINVEIQSDSLSNASTIGLIVGIVVVCVAAFMSILVLVIYMLKRQKIQKLTEKVSVSNQINEESIQQMNNMNTAKQVQQQQQLQMHNQITENKSAIFLQQ